MTSHSRSHLRPVEPSVTPTVDEAARPAFLSWDLNDVGMVLVAVLLCVIALNMAWPR